MPEEAANLLDEIEDAVIVRDLSGRIRLWNTAAEALYGWTAHEALGRHQDELLQTSHPVTARGVEALLLQNGRWAGDFARTSKEGRPLQVEAICRVRRGVAGEPISIVETGRDVTQADALRRRAEQVEDRYRNLFQAMAAAFWELDFTVVRRMLEGLHHQGLKDFRGYFAAHPEFIETAIASTIVVDVNHQTLELFGAAHRDDIVGRSIAPFWPPESHGVFAESLVAAVENRRTFMTETRFSTLAGAPIDALFTVCWPQENKGRGGILVGVIDLTERQRALSDLQRSELRYRNMFHASAVAFWELDFRPLNARIDELRGAGVTDLVEHARLHPELPDELLALTIVTDVNRTAVQLFGASRPEELMIDAATFWPPASRTVFLQSLNAALNDIPQFEAETRLATLDGREIDVLFTSAAPPGNETTQTVLLAMLDVSDRTRARADLERTRSELAHAARLSVLGELTASIAHEVRQPLAAIATNGAAGLRWLNRPSPDVAEAMVLLERMVADAQRAADIVSRTRGMATAKATAASALSGNLIVEDALRFLGHELQVNAITVHLDLDPDLLPIRCDRTQLQQVFVNLIINAVQAMAEHGAGSRELTVTSRNVADGSVRFTIKDTGPGVAGADAEKLFESFYTTKSEGLGIGLPICRSIVEAHGGKLLLESPSKGGAVFAFTLMTLDP